MKRKSLLLIALISLVVLLSSCTEKLTYLIAFDSNGGSLVESRVVSRGDKISKPSDPYKEGFIFEYWTFNDKEYKFDTKVSKKLTLKAKYKYHKINETTNYQGRKYSSVFDVLINDFTNEDKLSNNSNNVSYDNEAPYIKINYSANTGNSSIAPLYKELNNVNNFDFSYQYLVLRLRGSKGASLNDLSIGFISNNNDEIIKDFKDLFIGLESVELTDKWHNYVISLKDVLSLEAQENYQGFYLINSSKIGSGTVDIKEVSYAKTKDVSYPFNGNDYLVNDKKSVSYLGELVSSHLVINSNGYYGESLLEGEFNDSYLVLSLKQISPGNLVLNNIKVSPIFLDNSEGDKYSLDNINGLTSLGSNWLNVVVKVSDLYLGEKSVRGFKIYNESDFKVGLKEVFFTDFGEFELANYPLLDFANILILENFNREEIGNLSSKEGNNEIALNNGFNYIVSNSGLELTTLSDGYLYLNSNNKEIDYQIYTNSKNNFNEYRYLVIKYKEENNCTLTKFTLSQITSNEELLEEVDINNFSAGLGYPSYPNDLNDYPLFDGEWSYLVIDLLLTNGFNSDFAGFKLNYQGSGLVIDAFFFANQINEKEEDSILWQDFNNLVEGIVNNQKSEEEIEVSSNGTIYNDEDNLTLKLNGNNNEFYQTKTNYLGRYLELKIKVLNKEENILKLTVNNKTINAKDEEIILENGLALVVNDDGLWHTYIIDLLLSNLEVNGEIIISLSGNNIYLFDDFTWHNKELYYDDELVFGDFNNYELGDINNQEHDDLVFINNYGTDVSVVLKDGSNMLKINGSINISKVDFGVMDLPDFISFDLTVEKTGIMMVNIGGKDYLLTDLIDFEGRLITLPNILETKEIVIDLALSKITPNDIFGLRVSGGIYYLKDISFKFKDQLENTNIVFEEDFNNIPELDGGKYLTGNFNYFNDGELKLISDENASFKFTSNLIKNSSYLKYIIKTEEGYDGSSLRLELGENNIINYSDIISDGYVTELNDWYTLVVIPLEKYTNVRELKEIGFYINNDGVVIDDLAFLSNQYFYQMSIFTDEEVK